jgi:hypothetical protein
MSRKRFAALASIAVLGGCGTHPIVHTGPSTTAYVFTLPSGPVDPGRAEDALYQALTRHDCAAAQTRLDGGWATLRSPAYVLLFQAGIEACQDNLGQASRWYSRAKILFGPQRMHAFDLATPRVLYQTLTSVLRQIPPDSVDAVAGQPPRWAEDAVGLDRLDPRKNPPPAANPDRP